MFRRLIVPAAVAALLGVAVWFLGAFVALLFISPVIARRTVLATVLLFVLALTVNYFLEQREARHEALVTPHHRAAPEHLAHARASARRERLSRAGARAPSCGPWR